MDSKAGALVLIARKIDYRWIIAGSVLAYYFIYWGNITNFVTQIDHCPKLFCDFTGFFYPAGKAILSGGSFPAGFYYSTFAAILFSPFALFEQEMAIVVWGTLQLVSIGAFYFILERAIVQERYEKYLFLFLFITSAPLVNSVKWGQISPMITLGVFASFLLYQKGRVVPSAAILGSVIAVKYYPVIFLVYFLLKSDWRYILLCAATVLLEYLLLPIILFGPDGFWRFQQSSSAGIPTLIQLGLVNFDSQYISSVFAHLFLLQSPGLYFVIVPALMGYTIIFAAIWLVHRINTLKLQNEAIWACALLFSTLAFWLPNSWPHYFVYLPCLQILAFQIVKEWRGQKISLLFSSLWVLSIFSSNILLVNSIHSWINYAVMGWIFWSNLAVLIVSSIHFLKRPLSREVETRNEPALAA